MKNNKIPHFIQNRMDLIKKYKNSELPEPKIKLDDIWVMNPKRLFPHSPTLQKYFIDVRNEQKKYVRHCE